jgi:hypothetical protein
MFLKKDIPNYPQRKNKYKRENAGVNFCMKNKIGSERKGKHIENTKRKNYILRNFYKPVETRIQITEIQK